MAVALPWDIAMTVPKKHLHISILVVAVLAIVVVFVVGTTCRAHVLSKHKSPSHDIPYVYLYIYIYRRLGGVSSPLGRPLRNREIVSCRACVRADNVGWKCTSNQVLRVFPFPFMPGAVPFALVRYVNQ